MGKSPTVASSIVIYLLPHACRCGGGRLCWNNGCRSGLFYVVAKLFAWVTNRCRGETVLLSTQSRCMCIDVSDCRFVLSWMVMQPSVMLAALIGVSVAPCPVSLCDYVVL